MSEVCDCLHLGCACSESCFSISPLKVDNMKKNTGNFSIVETVEGAKTLISIVPHQWVNGKFLMWPDKNAENLIRDRSSTPSPKWQKIPCILKRKSIKTFAEAEAEAAEMSGHTDSDSQQPPPAKKFRTKGAAQQVSFQDLNFNEMMMNQGPSTSKGATDHSANQPLTSKTMESKGKNEKLAPELERSQPEASKTVDCEVQSVGKSEVLAPELEQLQPESDSLLTSIQGHDDYVQYVDGDGLKKEIFAKIEEMKTEIVKEVTDVVVGVMETLVKKTVVAIKCDFDQKLASLQQHPQEQEDDHVDFQFKPVSSAQELDELDKNLENKGYAKEVMAYMKNIIGNQGDNCKGINTSYLLIDHFFDKKFMPNCSWTGASRGESMKCSLQKCTKILNVFFSIVKSVNEHFSINIMETFFKNVTKNAKRRSATLGLRQSSTHHRGRRLNVGTFEVVKIMQDHNNSSANEESEICGNESTEVDVEDSYGDDEA